MIETYKKAEENFKLSMQERLNNLLVTEESDNQSGTAGENQKLLH